MGTRQVHEGQSAVVWVDEERAIVSGTTPDGSIESEQLERGACSQNEYLAHVVHEIGDRPRVSIVGPSAMRLALEREFVSISHRPERLVGIPLSRRATDTEILARMRRLAA
jgi:hypothetical protein